MTAAHLILILSQQILFSNVLISLHLYRVYLSIFPPTDFTFYLLQCTSHSLECLCLCKVQLLAPKWPKCKLQSISTTGKSENGGHHYTLNRKSLTCFVRTKPRGSVVITKPLTSQRLLCARKATYFVVINCIPLKIHESSVALQKQRLS